MKIPLEQVRKDAADRFLDRLEDPELSERGMFNLLCIEQVDSLCDLYVKCVHQNRDSNIRRMIGMLIENQMSKSNASLLRTKCKTP